MLSYHEGRNTRLLAEAFRHFSVDGVTIVDGLENMTGKDQLKTLFNFMCKLPHDQKVIFIWDCDVGNKMTEENNTYPIVMARNSENPIAKTGIENMFPKELFDGFVKKITRASGQETVEFDETCKRSFEAHILARADANDFIHFKAIAEEIKSIRDRK